MVFTRQRDSATDADQQTTDLFGVELHLVLGLWEQLDVVRAVDLLGNCSDLVSNRQLRKKTESSA